MKTNTFSNKKNRIMTRFVLLFTVLTVSQISYSCFKEKNVSPVYSEIPDANFEAYLKTIVPDAFTPDNKFISNHPSVVSFDKRMSIINKSIGSLSGIEYFTSLKELDCRDNKLATLDVSKNINLTSLNCGYNQLTTLNLKKNTKLTRLECYKNQLTLLDVSINMNLKWLNCDENQIISLNLGKNNVLRRIHCSQNQLTALDVSKNKNLTILECYRNQLTCLDISKNKSLTGLYCYNNNLSCLDVSKNKSLVFLCIDDSIKCCHFSIKVFKDRGGHLLGSYYQTIPPFTCP
ncbi:leucine-rich repeat domain-containing protein [Flavobacterium acetivorans]|uniref:leucine-rich repeat domain-containing protein n=1 Tax=Flavobacterium acetivorans TaxID=2893883 RepID=UPI001E5354F9|nr:hypothetical protein [Flavobacterium sp. F-29]UFH35066.1 hypothetical protein LNP19_13375 [Flavobacterium sp. F-29]